MTQQETMISRRDAFQALIDNTTFWHPEVEGVLQDVPLPTDDSGFVILSDDRIVTFARSFEQWSIDNGCSHKFNQIDRWTIYHNNKYQKVPDDDEIKKYMLKFLNYHSKLKMLNKSATKEQGKNVYFNANLINKYTSDTFVNNILKHLGAEGDIHIPPSKNAPCCLLGELDPHKTTAMSNGILDRRKYPHVLRPLSKDYYTMNYLDYEYDPTKQCDKWLEFLFRITDDDQDMVVLLQQWCGYILTNSNKYQKFFLCVGDGANGKGVFFSVLAAAIGRSNVSSVPLDGFTESAKLYSTFGKMVNMSSESAKHLERGAESIIKEYVGGDLMTWERKYNDAFSALPTARLMFATNELPRIYDTSDGIWRRMIYVPFDVQIPENERDVNLVEKLTTPEMLSGIFNWMLAGIESLETMGRFIQPKRCVDGLAQYRLDSNPIQRFADECFQPADEDRWLIKIEVYAFYKIWAANNGHKNIHAENTFAKAMYKALPWIQNKKVSKDGKQIRVFGAIEAQDGVDIRQGNE